MIKNIVFDAGGVIVRWNPYKVLERFVPDRSKWDELFEMVFNSEDWRRMDRGEYTSYETSERIAARAGALAQDARALTLGWPECVPRIEGTAELMSELKERGLGVYILSNWCENFYKTATLRPALDYADGALVSSEEKLAKPDERIYARLCEKFSLCADECLFTDDMPANVEAARRFGMQAVVFTTPEAFRRELETRGIL